MKKYLILLLFGVFGVMLVGGWSAWSLAQERSAEQFNYDDHGKRDPFWTLLGHRSTIVSYDNDIQATDLVLEGLLVEPGAESAAIINGNIVKVNDKVGLYTVKDIQQNMVVLEKGQETITLTTKKEE